MPPLEHSADGRVPAGPLLFAAIKVISAGARHVALVYVDSDGQPQICHLEWHFKLSNEKFSGGYFLGVSALDVDSQVIVAGWLEDLPRLIEGVPYGIDSAGCTFDRATGEYQPGPFGKGLTCATFIVAVFETLGLSLADYSTWPERPEDADWQKWILDVLRTHGADDSYLAAMKSDVGSRRIRPEEIVATVMLSTPPPALTFDQVEELSKEILAQLAA